MPVASKFLLLSPFVGKRLRIPSIRWNDSMFLHVTHAKPLDGYRVEVGFDDGREGIADLTDALKGPMFESLKDPACSGNFGLTKNFRLWCGPTERTWHQNLSIIRRLETIRNFKRSSANGAISSDPALDPDCQLLRG